MTSKLGNSLKGFTQKIAFQLSFYKHHVVQEAIDVILVNLELKDSLTAQDVNDIFKKESQSIKKVMGEGTRIKYNIVNHIKPSPSGKYMYAFSQIWKD